MSARASRHPRIRLDSGDITQLAVDAIVNAANSSLLAECRTLGGCPPGAAKLTGGYRLPVRHVIHAVGPIWQGGGDGEPETLASCYRACLALADQHALRTIAFPAISTGIYGFPRDPAAAIAVATVADHLAAKTLPETVIFVCFDRATQAAYEAALAAL